jgi:hypothetical protein
MKEREPRRIIGIWDEISDAMEETEKAIEGLYSVIWCKFQSRKRLDWRERQCHLSKSGPGRELRCQVEMRRG